jgi:tetratricopeptide (TPR) repeat protein
MDRHLQILERLEMIGEAARVPEVEYRFRNPLTQQVAYQSILLKQRREFHRRVAERMEQLYPDRLDEHSSLLEYHFAASDRRDKSIEYARRAARRAVNLYTYDDAVRHLRAALERIPKPPPDLRLKAHVLEELADVYRLLRDFEQAITLCWQAIEIANSMQDRTMSVRLHRKIIELVTEAKWSVDAETYRRVSELREISLSDLADQLAAFEQQPPHAETVRLFAALSMDAWRNRRPPDWDAAQRYAQVAVDMAERLDDRPLLSHALGALASALDGRSLLREHLAVALRRSEITREPEFDDLREHLDALRGLGAALMYVGEYEQALPLLQEAEGIAVRVQAADQQANTLGLQAQCRFRLDRWDEVLETELRWRELERHYPRERVGET